MPATKPIKVLVVDDNRPYREAFSRNLEVEGMVVLQAEHADRALEILKTDPPDVMVTDLRMRTHTEGLGLIRDARATVPCLPVIMISAVGTFDEGAAASQLGAAHVLSKARIEEEISILHDCIRKAHARYQHSRRALDEIAEFSKASDGPEGREHALTRLREILGDADADAYVKAEAFDALNLLTADQTGAESRSEMTRAVASMAAGQKDEMEQVDGILCELIPSFQLLHEETRDTLRTAEYLFHHADTLGSRFDLSRSTCFAYCFSVENQAKTVTRKRTSRFFADEACGALVRRLLDRKTGHVNIFFQQHILQTMRDRAMDFTIDHVRQTFLRILEHGAKYRPDGLKALGIILLSFGRTYEFKDFNQVVRVDNPLGLKGLEDDAEMVRLVELLVNLQHFRNPYIHPEVTDRQALGKIRDTAIQCMNMVMRLR